MGAVWKSLHYVCGSLFTMCVEVSSLCVWKSLHYVCGSLLEVSSQWPVHPRKNCSPVQSKGMEPGTPAIANSQKEGAFMVAHTGTVV